MTASSRLVMSQGPQPGQTFTLENDLLTLGRDPSNNIAIDNPQISRQHARIVRQGSLMVIEDLGSTNGTFVNGMRLTSPHTLANDDVIGLGDAVRLTYYGAAADAETGMAETEVLVGRPTRAPSPAIPQPMSPPAYAPPPPSAYTPPPPPAYAPPPPPIAPPAEEKKSKTGLWFGCGCLVLLVILACVAIFALDYLELLPDFFYQPLFWLGLDKYLAPAP